MSCTFYAHTIVGIPVNPDRLFTEQKVKAFEHDHPEDWEVDPVTQKKLWTTEMVPAEGVEAEYEDETLVAGYEVVYVDEGRTAYIAVAHGDALSDGGPTDTDYTGLPEQVEIDVFREELEKVGFWPAGETVGIYTILEARG